MLVSGVLVDDAEARWPTRSTANRWGQAHAAATPWHGQHYHTSYGRPVAMIVPPTVQSYTHHGWGVTGTEVRPMHQQFRANHGFDLQTMDAPGLYGTPPWPQNTDQFGVYYVRGPW